MKMGMGTGMKMGMKMGVGDGTLLAKNMFTS